MIDDMLQTSFLRSASLPQDAGHLFAEEDERFQEMMMMYSCAIKAVKTKLQVLNDELSMTRKRNPIEFIETRVKRPDSIATKLKKKHLPISVESVRSNLNDVAGVRVICAFLDDIYKVADMLTAQDDVELIKTKDYIKKPKMNGYRSLHLIISVPVYFSDHKEQIRVEVQIRTIAMDFWASLEHQVKYKKNVKDAESVMYELRACADVINRTDCHMQSIRDRIVEIDSRALYTYKGNYSYYLEKRQERIEARNAEIDRANNLLRTELDWMRRQPQARGTKAKYRIDAFYELEKKARAEKVEENVTLAVKSLYIGSKILK